MRSTTYESCIFGSNDEVEKGRNLKRSSITSYITMQIAVRTYTTALGGMWTHNASPKKQTVWAHRSAAELIAAVERDNLLR